MSNGKEKLAEVATSTDEELLRAMTFETGVGFAAAHARVVERSELILKPLGRGAKIDKLPRLQQALVRVARSYGADQTVAFQIACEEIQVIEDLKKAETQKAEAKALVKKAEASS